VKEDGGNLKEFEYLCNKEINQPRVCWEKVNGTVKIKEAARQ
jgi:hypothetical protein